MTEPTYTLKEAKQKLAELECHTNGHDISITEGRYQGNVEVLGAYCDRCYTSWDLKEINND